MNNYLDIINQVLEKWWTKIATLTPNLVLGILVFLIFVLLSKNFSKYFTNILVKIFHNNENKATPILLGKISKYLLLIIGTFISLEIMHLGDFMTKLLGSLGIAGIIAGVALKDLVSSIFSGFLINVEKSFEIGDEVTISNIKGTVEDIGFLTVKLKTDLGETIFVPNQLIFTAPFINHTRKQ